MQWRIMAPFFQIQASSLLNVALKLWLVSTDYLDDDVVT